MSKYTEAVERNRLEKGTAANAEKMLDAQGEPPAPNTEPAEPTSGTGEAKPVKARKRRKSSMFMVLKRELDSAANEGITVFASQLVTSSLKAARKFVTEQGEDGATYSLVCVRKTVVCHARSANVLEEV